MNLVRDIWERFLLYVPLTIMVVLALGTYWLVQSTPVLPDIVAPHATRHEPDYFMRGFSLRSFDPAGHLRTEVQGVEGRHYPDTRLLEIDDIRIRAFDTQGRLTTATAQRGLTNEDTSEFQLLGHAVVVREALSGAQPQPRMEYRGEFLHAFLNTEKIRSHKPVELLRGNDHFSADTLDYDNVEQVLQLKGRVRGTLMPANP